MSETVHYRGKAIKLSKDPAIIEELAELMLAARGKTEYKKYYDGDAVKCLCEEFCEDYFYHSKSKTLYRLETSKQEEWYDDIISAERINSVLIGYELRYYNGGASFNECLEEALDDLYKQERNE